MLSTSDAGLRGARRNCSILRIPKVCVDSVLECRGCRAVDVFLERAVMGLLVAARALEDFTTTSILD